MASVNLPEKCLQDPGRGRAWLLTAVGHFGGQEVIDEVEQAIKTAILKGVSWKKILSESLKVIAEVIIKGEHPVNVAAVIDAIPAPKVAETVE